MAGAVAEKARRAHLRIQQVVADDAGAPAAASPSPAGSGSMPAMTGRGSDPPPAIYLFSPDRRTERPVSHLAKCKGVVQVDGYPRFERLKPAAISNSRPAGPMRCANSMMCRRRHRLSFAAESMRRIADLHAIETVIRGETAASNSTPTPSSGPFAASRSAARISCSPGPTAASRAGQLSAPSSPPRSSLTSSLRLPQGRVGTHIQRTSHEPPRQPSAVKLNPLKHPGLTYVPRMDGYTKSKSSSPLFGLDYSTGTSGF